MVRLDNNPAGDPKKRNSIVPNKNVQTQRRREIMEALHKCLLKKPFDKTSIKEIAATAGMNHGMLHYYFKSKEDILLNYIDYELERYAGLFGEWFIAKGSRIGNDRELLKAGIDFMIRNVTLNRNLNRVFIEIWEIAIYNKKVKKKLRRFYLQWIEMVEQFISGPIGDEEIAQKISKAIVALHEGSVLFSILFEPEEFSLEMLLKDFQNMFLEMLVQK